MSKHSLSKSLLTFLFIFSLFLPLSTKADVTTDLSSLQSLLNDLQQQISSIFQFVSNNISPSSNLAQISGAGSGLVGYWTFDEGKE